LRLRLRAPAAPRPRRRGLCVAAVPGLAPRTPPASGLLCPLPRQLLHLVGVHIQHDLAAARIRVLDRHRRCVPLVDLVPTQITDENRLARHSLLLFPQPIMTHAIPKSTTSPLRNTLLRKPAPSHAPGTV